MTVPLRVGGDGRASIVRPVLVQQEITQIPTPEELLALRQLINEMGQMIVRYRTEVNESQERLAEVIRRAETTASRLRTERIVTGTVMGALGGGLVGGLAFGVGAIPVVAGIGVGALVGIGGGAAYDYVAGDEDSLQHIINEGKQHLKRGSNNQKKTLIRKKH